MAKYGPNQGDLGPMQAICGPFTQISCQYGLLQDKWALKWANIVYFAVISLYVGESILIFGGPAAADLSFWGLGILCFGFKLLRFDEIDYNDLE